MFSQTYESAFDHHHRTTFFTAPGSVLQRSAQTLLQPSPNEQVDVADESSICSALRVTLLPHSSPPVTRLCTLSVLNDTLSRLTLGNGNCVARDGPLPSCMEKKRKRKRKKCTVLNFIHLAHYGVIIQVCFPKKKVI